ncbi:hypothetical protein BC826DRAFT_1179751 [Russula brevipes]|nr:hypothetical protein BC826DRAFT_1179751 [Russula brevipes]
MILTKQGPARYCNGYVDPMHYQAKGHVPNQALQEIGTGKYQAHIPVYLLGRCDNVNLVGTIAVAGFGWFFVWPVERTYPFPNPENEFSFQRTAAVHRQLSLEL